MEDFKVPTYTEHLNEKKYQNTWYPDITKAQSFDRREDGIPYQRDLLQRINPDIFDDKTLKAMSDKDVRKYLNNKKLKIKTEEDNIKAREEILNMLSILNNADELIIHASNGNVGKAIAVDFCSQFFISSFNGKYKEISLWLNDAQRIEIQASSSVKDEWTVLYDGTIEKNSDGNQLKFKGVSNGFAVNIG